MWKSLVVVLHNSLGIIKHSVGILYSQSTSQSETIVVHYYIDRREIRITCHLVCQLWLCFILLEMVFLFMVNNESTSVTHVYAVEDASEGAVVQRKGRFKVTSADLSPKVYLDYYTMIT